MISPSHKNSTKLKWLKDQKQNGMEKQHTQCITNGHANIVVEVMCPGSVQHMEKHVLVMGRWATSRRYAGVGGTAWFHEVGIEMAQESQEEEIETVSINSIYLNKNQLLITAHLKTQVGKTTIEVPYKIDTGSEGNLIPLYISESCSKICWRNRKKGP